MIICIHPHHMIQGQGLILMSGATQKNWRSEKIDGKPLYEV